MTPTRTPSDPTTDARRPFLILVISVEHYLNEPLVALARREHGDGAEIVAVRANRHLDKRFVLRLFFWLLPFRLRAIYTPSDLGGRLVRLLVDLAALRGVPVYVVPAHNHVWHRDRRVVPWLRYIDLSVPRVVGGFARRSRIIVNDEPMRRFFESLGYNPGRLVMKPGWIESIYHQPRAAELPVVFFTEVLQELDTGLRDKVLAQVRALLDTGALDGLHVKLHPREPADVAARYHEVLGSHPAVTFIDPSRRSIDVINGTHVVMACLSTVLLEALWLKRNIIVLDNPFYRGSLLGCYLEQETFFVLGDETPPDEVRTYCKSVFDGAR